MMGAATVILAMEAGKAAAVLWKAFLTKSGLKMS